MDRRQLLQVAATLPLAAVPGRSAAATPALIGDMHFHSFFGQSLNHSRPIGPTFAAGPATLVAWAVSGDGLWIEPYERGWRQKSEPAPGAAKLWVEREIGRIKAHLADQGIAIATRRADVDLALAGVPHVVLAVEGASFIEADPGRVTWAFDLGIRHLQLIHFIRSPLGDLQTEVPAHGGLTDLGRQVIAECNRLGILVDLAHATPATVHGALAASRAPMVWSHSSVLKAGAPDHRMVAWRARQLALADAKAIAGKGGVIGLWGVTRDVGPTTDGYADRLLEMAELLGDEHAAIGSDINGLGPIATLKSYADLRRVVERWQAHGVPPPRLHRLAIGNYARVLKAAMRS
jgi:membrane dipeptidase